MITLGWAAGFCMWSIGCVAIGVLLSRRLITTTTDLYATLYHDARQAKQDYLQLAAKAKGKTGLVEPSRIIHS